MALVLNFNFPPTRPGYLLNMKTPQTPSPEGLTQWVWDRNLHLYQVFQVILRHVV